MSRFPALAALAAWLLTAPATARTLSVGEGGDYRLPSEAIAAAQDGDTISIHPGIYFDCAIVRSNGLTIVGEGNSENPSTLTDKICEEKAILVLRGNNVTVRNLTLQRARAPDGNGAGIRLENADLAVDRVRFVNDQVGILSGTGGGRVVVTNSAFDGGGVGGAQPKYALMIGQSAQLRVTGCRFAGGRGGQISTAAGRSDILDDTIGVGTGDPEQGPASAVLATEGTLVMERDIITVGPLVPHTGAAISVWDGATATLRGNTMINQTGQSMALLQDWSWGSPSLQDNRIGPDDQLVTTNGVWRHRAANQYHARKADAHDLAKDAKHMLERVLGR